MSRHTLTMLLLVSLVIPSLSRTAVGEDQLERWCYASVNFQVDARTDQFIALMKRAKEAGYQSMVVTDYKFGKLDGRIERYYENLWRVGKTARELNMELIPCVMPIGHSNSILQNDPNLAAGVPVKNCHFVVQNGEARVKDQHNLFQGGALDSITRKVPTGWTWVDGYGVSSHLDERIKHSGKASLRLENFAEGNEARNCRLVKKLHLKPFHQYQFTIWVKTNGWKGSELKLMPLGNGKALNYAHLGVQKTQDWTKHSIVFNTLDREEISLYVGVWDGEAGTIWLDDASLHLVGGVNLVRRKGCPIKVTSLDGSRVYEEGKDFERWTDPKLGMVPYEGEFNDDHQPMPIRLTKDSQIQEGEELSVSFYHTLLIHDGQVSCSLIDEKLFDYLFRQVQLIDHFLKPKRYFMQHDELRVAGYDIQEEKRTAGSLLAENAKRCIEVIRHVNPKAGIMVWSDMFDPHHNAREGYYFVKSSLRGSWEGLPRDVVIVNWNQHKSKDSLSFFARRGHRQIIAGYYDSNPEKNVERWLAPFGKKPTATTLQKAGINGFMYTTWRDQYKDLESFSKLIPTQ